MDSVRGREERSGSECVGSKYEALLICSHEKDVETKARGGFFYLLKG